MEEDDDYLTCGKCMTEFPLDKITSFIKHKKKDCKEPGQEATTGLQPELVCSSCPQGFMTAVGLLKHAQTIHNFKLFLEKSANVTGIKQVRVSSSDDTGQICIQDTVLGRNHINNQPSDKPLIYDVQLQREQLTSQLKQSNKSPNLNFEQFNTGMSPSTTGNLLPDSIQMGSSDINRAQHDQSTATKFDNLKTSLSSSPTKNFSSSVLRAIVKSGVIFPVMNKQHTDVQMTEERVNKQMDPQLNKQTRSLLTEVKPTIQNGTLLTGEQQLKNDTMKTGVPVKEVISPVDTSTSFLKSNISLLKSDVHMSVTTKFPIDISNLSDKVDGNLLNNNFQIKSNNAAEVSPENPVEVDSELTIKTENPHNADSELDESNKISCCDSQKCGVTVIPGTHEGLKKCCNAVVPKKRKRHFETKHTVSARQKLSRRLSGCDVTRSYRNVDNTRRNSGTIFIDLEPNEDGTLSQKSNTNNPTVCSSVNEVDFQVSGLCREANSSSQGRPKGKGSVILPPGAVFSIPFSYSLTTQTDGSLRPLVISKRTFQSQPTSVSVNASKNQENSQAVSETTSYNISEDKDMSLSDGNSDGNHSNNLEIDLTCNSDGNQSRRRRYPTSRPFKCDKCDSAFNQRIHLKKHMSKHTGVKPFKCHQCNYSTVERSHLKVHIRIHTGEKPFKCTYCEYATAQNSTLKIHLKRHHRPSQGHGMKTLS